MSTEKSKKLDLELELVSGWMTVRQPVLRITCFGHHFFVLTGWGDACHKYLIASFGKGIISIKLKSPVFDL